MITITDFTPEHISAARDIAFANYFEEKSCVPALPELHTVPGLLPFADNRLGVTAMNEGRVVGFLCCYAPYEHIFGSAAKGVFSPMHAHGAIKENREYNIGCFISARRKSGYQTRALITRFHYTHTTILP